jgi:peptide/nickel transport system substrate-binding protein
MEQLNYWQRLQKRRVSRRNLLVAGGTVALGGATAMVVGCGGGGDDNGSSNENGTGSQRTPNPNASPTPGGNVTFGRLLNVLGIDPHIDLTGLDIDLLLYPYLYGWNPIDEEIIFNNLAESLEMPDPEHLEFIFTLKQGWMNSPGDFPGAGEELTSEDVKQSFVRRGTSITAPDKRFAYKIAGSKDPTMLAPALETPDKYTFRFQMKEPFVPAVREMANPTWGIVPKKVIDEYGLGLSQRAFGGGPYMLDSFRGTERIVLKKNPTYYYTGKGGPYLDTITYIVILESSSLLSAFENGDHDVNGSILTKDWYDDNKDDSRWTVVRGNTFFYPCIQYKVIRAPFNDPRVLEAMDLALDRDDFINQINYGEGQYNGPIQWVQRTWALPQEELREFYRSDRQKATQLLESAGYGDGFSATMKIPKVTGAEFIADAASLIKNQLAEVKIDVNIDEVEIGTFIASTILPGNFDMTFFPNLPYDEPDRPLSFYHSLGVTGNGNWTNYTNPELDKLIDQQSKEFDLETRKQTILEAQRIMIREHGPQITLTSGYQYTARWGYVHFPFEFGEAPPDDVLPQGVDIWTEESSG